MDTGITIDAVESRDLDDAIWVEHETEQKSWTVHATIADVAAHVIKSSPVDDSAYGRVESKYFANGRTRSMLPRHIERNLSLNESDGRAGLCIGIHLDAGLNPIRLPHLQHIKFTNRKRFAYEDIPGILADAEHEWHGQMELLSTLATGLMEKRRAKGAFVFYDLNTGWVTTEEGALRRLKDTGETIGYIIVQELMILANGEVARLCAEKEIPVPWRNHTAKAHAPDRKDLMEQIHAAVHKPLTDIDLLRRQAHMTMNRAEYGSRLQGHYGLNLPGYVHCTSPIRRYADLVTQRQIGAWIREDDFPYAHEEIEEICQHINARAEAIRDRDSEFGKTQADAKAKERIRAKDLTVLSAKEFERVTKVLARSGEWNDVFFYEFLRRLDGGILGLIDMHMLLVEAPRNDELWRSLRQSVIDHLAEHPNKSMSVAMMCQQLSGWREIRYNVKRKGPDHAIRHEVKASIKRENLIHESTKIVASSIKLAKQRACVDVLALVCGLDRPEWDEIDPPGSAAKVVEDIMVPEAGINPISALQEYAQALSEPMPVYRDERVGGVDHAPMFKTTCEFRGRTCISEATQSKKTAKKDAARRMLGLLGK